MHFVRADESRLIPLWDNQICIGHCGNFDTNFLWVDTDIGHKNREPSVQSLAPLNDQANSDPSVLALLHLIP